MKNLLLALALAAPATVFAAKPCDVVTRNEASQLLGAPVGAKTFKKVDADASRCVIKSAKGGHDTLAIELRKVAADDAEHMRAHTDEERGEEMPSLHDELWYEVSAVDSNHPNDRRMVIHRDRTVLTLDVHSAHQADAKAAFETIWVQIGHRLPESE
jgi:hypothetical protein